MMKKENKKTPKQQAPAEGSVEALQTEVSRAPVYGECLPKKVECLNSRQGKVTKQHKVQVVHELRLAFPLNALFISQKFKTTWQLLKKGRVT